MADKRYAPKASEAIKMLYDLEISKVIKEIKRTKAKKVLIQLPDGLKEHAIKIASEIQKKTSAEAHIWLGSNFGKCDIPEGSFDLVINFGH